ncbi:hypothetical protein E3E31_12000 [Thermococcus sp. M39]|uniref:hypothetical protein n=1 Tax=Thermococcus sp. M39 TaxID=1638262 RepID=UPI00143C747B|nr:hypothetical protein [Thermococcus sp. M39]NJE09230.1 hypothetical protein [Thermococcus sp. M39]
MRTKIMKYYYEANRCYENIIYDLPSVVYEDGFVEVVVSLRDFSLLTLVSSLSQRRKKEKAVLLDYWRRVLFESVANFEALSLLFYQNRSPCITIKIHKKWLGDFVYYYAYLNNNKIVIVSEDLRVAMVIEVAQVRVHHIIGKSCFVDMFLRSCNFVKKCLAHVLLKYVDKSVLALSFDYE